MNEILLIFMHPAGLVSIGLIGFAIGLFIWNLFIRGELTPYEIVVKRDARLPDVQILKEKLADYFSKTHLLTRREQLYDLSVYGLEQNVSLKLVVPFNNLLINNNEYQRLKVDDDTISEFRESIEVTTERLGSKKLKKLIYQVFGAEHQARSQQIAIRLFRNKYPHTERNENKLLVAESHTKEPNKVRIFGKCLRDLYKHIRMMERGEDL